MIKGTTESGFEFNVDETVLNDIRFVDALVEMQSTDDNLSVQGMYNCINMLLGKEQKAKLYDHIAGIHGKPLISETLKEVIEIISSLKNGKN